MCERTHSNVEQSVSPPTGMSDTCSRQLGVTWMLVERVHFSNGKGQRTVVAVAYSVVSPSSSTRTNRALAPLYI